MNVPIAFILLSFNDVYCECPPRELQDLSFSRARLHAQTLAG